MTPEEENKLLHGPFPWRGPGFIVTRYGLVKDLPPSPNWKKKAWHKDEEERREEMQEVRERVYEETKDLSRSELQATIKMTRDELILRWDQLEKEGEKVVKAHEHFQEWIAERLQDTYREEPEGARWPYSLRVEKLRPWNEIVRTGWPRLETQHAYIKLRTPNSRTFNDHLRTAHLLLRRYSTLRYKRLNVAWGTSRSEKYEPSPSAQKALSAVAGLAENGNELNGNGLASASLTEVWNHVEEEVGIVNARANVRQDMRGRGKAPNRYPQTTEDLVELALEVAGNKRSQTFAADLDPPE